MVQISHHFMCMRYRHMFAYAYVRNTVIAILAGDDGFEISRNVAPINNLHTGLKPAAVNGERARQISTTPNHISPLGRPVLAHRRYL